MKIGVTSWARCKTTKGNKMNPNTGEIKLLEKFLTGEPRQEIPEKELPKVMKMNRQARRAWAAKNRKANKNNEEGNEWKPKSY